MASEVAAPIDFLSQFRTWGDEKREELLFSEQNPARQMDEELKQGVVFREDFKRCVHAFSAQVKYEIASVAQCISTIVISSFALIAEFCCLCDRTISASTFLKNICVIPGHIISSILKTAFFIARAADKAVTAVSVTVGFLAWHSGEWIVRLIKGSSYTVLSNHGQIRNIVYKSLGITLLAAGAVFIPIAPIQMIALPIILGSIYGTINNQFTMRECPEYYTMGHFYDGTNLKWHAIKTNNLLIKPIVTGCYATTMVTKFAGAILAAVGALPYAAAVLPVSYATAMIGGVCVISLVVAHIFSTMKKNSIQKNLNEYAELIGMQWTEENRNKSWYDLYEVQNEHIEQKREELASDVQGLASFNQRLQKLTDDIESKIFETNTPIKYIVGWQANNTRNKIGYLFAGGGTLVLSISVVFLRIFALS